MIQFNSQQTLDLLRENSEKCNISGLWSTEKFPPKILEKRRKTWKIVEKRRRKTLKNAEKR